MLKKSNTSKILSLLFKNPTTNYHIRQIAELLKISPPTVLTAMKELKKNNLVTEKKTKVMTIITANTEYYTFKRKKRIFNLNILYESNIIDFIINEYRYPQAIILFGSFARGEDIESSDIDIAVITNKKKDLNLTMFENKLQRTINIHEIDINKVSKEFKNNLYNGIVLEGAL